MERISKSEFLVGLNIQEQHLDSVIDKTRLELYALITQRNQLTGIRITLDRLERDGMRITFTEDENGSNFVSEAKDQAGFVSPR